MFVDQCDKCQKMFVRDSPAPTVGQKYTGTVGTQRGVEILSFKLTLSRLRQVWWIRICNMKIKEIFPIWREKK
jgi:hypothetical protein